MATAKPPSAATDHHHPHPHHVTPSTATTDPSLQSSAQDAHYGTLTDRLYNAELARRSVARAALHLGIDRIEGQALDCLGDALLEYLDRVSFWRLALGAHIGLGIGCDQLFGKRAHGTSCATIFCLPWFHFVPCYVTLCYSISSESDLLNGAVSNIHNACALYGRFIGNYWLLTRGEFISI